jgi:oxygen-independent coproporphyrinogen III oxidase
MPGVYLSYPFCAQKCSYCNFASGVQPRDLEPRYLGALRAEIEGMRWPWEPETVFIGGGTPSRMDTGDLAGLLALIPGRPWREATIEVAPGSITRAKAEAWAKAWPGAGINRVSLGVQSFVQRELARTGRTHTAEIVAGEIATLREAGLGNFNIDLIAGLPGQTLDSWNASLDWIARLEPPHVSVYMLEVDEDSRLGAEVLALGQRYGAGEVPSDDAIADFYEVAVARLASLGIPRYEISNFARAGFESRHNLKYWRREPYLGFGADAHSFDGRGDQGARWQNAESALEYVELAERGESPVVTRTTADTGERFFLGLRLTEGVEADWSAFAPAVEEFARQGLLEIDGQKLRLTPRGVMLSNEVFQEFL